MAASSLSNLECKKLFEDWGFVPVGGNGGHLMMEYQPSGKRVQITAPGRNTPTPMRALQKAAKEVGVSLAEFKAGPPEAPKKPAPQIDLTEPEPEVHSTPQPVVEAKPEERVLAWQNPERTQAERIAAYLQARSPAHVQVSDIARAVGMPSNYTSIVLTGKLMKDDPERVKRVKKGWYFFDDSVDREAEARARREAELARRDAERRERAEAEARKSSFTKVGEDTFGRTMLSDAEGNFWVAIRCEPGFMPMRPTRQPVLAGNGNGNSNGNSNGHH